MALDSHSYSHPAEFLRANSEELLKREAFHSLFLGLATLLAEEADLPVERRRYQEVFQRNVYEGDVLRFAVLRTPPYPLAVAAFGPAMPADLAALAQLVHKDQPSISGVNGERTLAVSFANQWTELTGQLLRIHHEQRLYELREVQTPRAALGVMRVADPNDTDLVAEWTAAFCRDADVTHAEATIAQSAIRVQSGDIFLWENDGQPVSMAATTRPTLHGISISLVFTPSELRGRGYASNLVATLSQRMLDSVYDFCTLYTDLTNPTSNSIYQRIGYRPVADFVEMAAV